MFFAKTKNNLFKTTIEAAYTNTPYINIGFSNYGIELTNRYEQSTYLFYLFFDRDEFSDYIYNLTSRNSYFTIETAPLLAFLRQINSINNSLEISIDNRQKITISQTFANSVIVFSYSLEITHDIPYQVDFYDYPIELDISSHRLLAILESGLNIKVASSVEKNCICFSSENYTYLCDNVVKKFKIKSIDGSVRLVNKQNDYRLYRLVNEELELNTTSLLKFRDIINKVSNVQLNIMPESHIRLDILLDSDIGNIAHIFLEID
jgi:hypothetical protein